MKRQDSGGLFSLFNYKGATGVVFKLMVAVVLFALVQVASAQQVVDGIRWRITFSQGDAHQDGHKDIWGYNVPMLKEQFELCRTGGN